MLAGTVGVEEPLVRGTVSVAEVELDGAPEEFVDGRLGVVTVAFVIVGAGVDVEDDRCGSLGAPGDFWGAGVGGVVAGDLCVDSAEEFGGIVADELC